MCIVIMSAVIHVHAPHSRADAAVEQIHKTTGDRAYNELFWRQDLVASNQIRYLNLLLGNALSAARTHYSRPHVFCGYL